MDDQELTKLEQRVQALIDWKNKRVQERLSYPLDPQSIITKNKGLFVFTGKVLGIDYIRLITNSMAYGYEISVNGKINTLLVSLKIFPFTVNITTDFITNTQGAHNLNNGDRITLTTDGGMPTPLDLNIIYYIVNRTGTTFQLSLTNGGAPIDITFDPGDNYYYAKIQ